jgi:hypothetical protein
LSERPAKLTRGKRLLAAPPPGRSRAWASAMPASGAGSADCLECSETRRKLRLPLSATDKWQAQSMNEKTRAILTEHLPYELNMLEAAFTFLHSPDFKDVHRIGFVRNAAIEAFWLHARNLIEFLAHRPGGGEIGTVSARDFAPDFYPETIMKQMDQRINAATTHLQYERTGTQSEKLSGHDMRRVKEHIDREIKRFEAALLPKFKNIWVPRQPTEWVIVDGELSATNSTTSMSLVINYAGQ